MLSVIMASGEGILPGTFQFLGLGWWIVHIVSIPVVFYVGHIFGRKSATKAAEETPPAPSGSK